MMTPSAKLATGAIDPVHVTIDGVGYDITPLLAGRGKAFVVRMAPVLGPALEKLAADADALRDGGADPRALAVIAAAARLLFSAPELAPLVADMTAAFAANTRVRLPDGAEPVLSDIYDAYFAARYEVELAWFVEVFRLNFAGFIGGVAGLLHGAWSDAATGPSASASAST